MAIEFFSGLGGLGSNIATGLGRGLIFSVIFGSMLGIALYIIRQRKFDHIVRIFVKDTMGNFIEKRVEKAGFFMDKKTKNRLFLMRKLKVGLKPDKVPFILSESGKRVVYLIQTGLKNYQFLGTPTISDNPGLVFNVQDEDVAWAMNAFDRYKIPNSMNKFMQLLPYIGIAVFGIIIIMGLWIVLDKFEIIAQVAASMNEASINLAKASLGTTVIQ